MSQPTIEDAARCYAAGDMAGAERCGHAIVAAEPRHFDALHLLGVLCINTGRFADAAGYLRRAGQERPDLAQIHYHLGNALLGAKLFDAAQAAFHEALRLQPGDFDALNNLGNALSGAGRHAEAIGFYHQALRQRPDAPPALFNLGRALSALQRYEEAEAAYRTALAHAKGAPADRLGDLVSALCQLFIDQERYADALAVLGAAPPELAGNPVVAWNESLTRLMLGDYAAGWRLYERRFEVPDHDPPLPSAQVLDLAAVAGKRVLVFGEQGRGDVIQFARYLPLLAERGATVLVEAYPDLLLLLAEVPGVADAVEPDGPAPDHDLLTPLLSLPLAFGTELASIPARVPYLRAPEARITEWSAGLGLRVKPRVGLSWWGFQHIPKRSMPGFVLDPLLQHGDLEFHAVQKDITPSDADWLARNPAVHAHAAELRDFAATAALLRHMDLVISIDTAVAHLAGALGRPVWIMLPFSPDWRWLRDREDSPWYPTARLFRQHRNETWPEVVRRVADALSTWHPADTHEGPPA